MNEEVKKIWVEALESGEYTQSHHALRTNHGYCCLGVLCDLYDKQGQEGNWSSHEDNNDTIWRFNTPGAYDLNVLPIVVREWAGLRSGNPSLLNGGSLAQMNDAGHDFKAIAAIIKAEL